MTQKQFIQNVLILEIKNIVDGHKYLSFGLITNGIELLGICIESPKSHFYVRNKSADRFRGAVDQLFPSKYKQFNNLKKEKSFGYDLYSELRCGMNHSVLPGPKVALSERMHGHKNLSIQNNQLVLVAEDFYDDFKNACEKVIAKIDKGEISERFAMNSV